MKNKRKIKIHLRQTDATGVIYYPELFIYHIDFLEDFLPQSSGPLPMRRAEGECLAPIFYKDLLEQEMVVRAIGTTSFTVESIFRKNEKIVAKCSATHVHVDPIQGKSIALSEAILQVLRACQELS